MILGNLPLASFFPLAIASRILGWSEPRLTKQWVMPASHSASKKANEAVYMLSCDVAGADDSGRVDANRLGAC
jgi:hypothetical protein